MAEVGDAFFDARAEVDEVEVVQNSAIQAELLDLSEDPRQRQQSQGQRHVRLKNAGVAQSENISNELEDVKCFV